jgi:hypothetical protein
MGHTDSGRSLLTADWLGLGGDIAIQRTTSRFAEGGHPIDAADLLWIHDIRFPGSSPGGLGSDLYRTPLLTKDVDGSNVHSTIC